jgi:UDP-N-acetylglucosamine 4,6-dehydratase/5-epimerase
MNMESGMDRFTGKTVLVTGGAGSIGRELVKKILLTDVRSVRVLDNNETGLHDVALDFDDPRMRLLIGDITNEKRMMRAMQNVDLVFHTAALKHVPLCEYNPFEAAEVNVRGTQNCIDASIANNVKKMIFISTDKVVSPFNVMGATKLVAERLTIAANAYSTSTKFSCVRFGNVLNSRGSVVPLFKKQILGGGPLTITNPAMTRFIMTISQAVDLILDCARETEGDDIFILKMPSIKIQDLALAMINYCHEAYGSPKNIPLKIIGIRAGEKISEELISHDELGKLEDHGNYFVIKRNKSETPGFLNFSYSSDKETALSLPEIEKILRETRV